MNGWHDAAAETLALRRVQAPRRGRRFRPSNVRWLMRRCQEALIRQDFAYRFYVAMQETCAIKRHAAIEKLVSEQQAALRQVRETSTAEEKADRKQNRAAVAASQSEKRAVRRVSVRLKRRRPRRPIRLTRRPTAQEPRP